MRDFDKRVKSILGDKPTSSSSTVARRRSRRRSSRSAVRQGRHLRGHDGFNLDFECLLWMKQKQIIARLRHAYECRRPTTRRVRRDPPVLWKPTASTGATAHQQMRDTSIRQDRDPRRRESEGQGKTAEGPVRLTRKRS